MKIISRPLSMAGRRCFLDGYEKQNIDRAKYLGFIPSFRNSRKKKQIWERGKLRQTGLCRRGQEKRKIVQGIAKRLRKRVFLHCPREPNSFAPIWDPFNVTFPPHIQYDGVSLFDGRGRRKRKGDRKKKKIGSYSPTLVFSYITRRFFCS